MFFKSFLRCLQSWTSGSERCPSSGLKVWTCLFWRWGLCVLQLAALPALDVWNHFSSYRFMEAFLFFLVKIWTNKLKYSPALNPVPEQRYRHVKDVFVTSSKRMRGDSVKGKRENSCNFLWHFLLKHCQWSSDLLFKLKKKIVVEFNFRVQHRCELCHVWYPVYNNTFLCQRQLAEIQKLNNLVRSPGSNILILDDYRSSWLCVLPQQVKLSVCRSWFPMQSYRWAVVWQSLCCFYKCSRCHPCPLDNMNYCLIS